MFRFVGLCFGMLVRFFRGRRSLLLENLALRQQLVALKRRHPRPSLGLFDKLFWVIARWVWSAWKHSLILVTPETVVRWHRTGFRIYWRLISRVLSGFNPPDPIAWYGASCCCGGMATRHLSRRAETPGDP